MSNSANGTSAPWYQQRLVQGSIAALVIGGGFLFFGRDSLFFYNGLGGDGWKMGHGDVHVFNAHFDRDVEKARQKALALVNRDREANGLAPLVIDSRLDESAQKHAEDMAQRNFLSNFSPEGESPSDRFVAVGGSGFVAGNIGAQGDEEKLTYRRIAMLERAWMYERRDRENVLNPQFNQFGFGIAIDKTDGEIYAVQLFRNDGTVATQPPLKVDAATTATATANPFYHAVKAAMAAAVAAQTAQTPQEWAGVARTWQTAVVNMKAVTPDHPRYATAQQKATEYSKNFDYARQNAGAAFVAQQPATTIVDATVSNPPEAAASNGEGQPATNPGSEQVPEDSKPKGNGSLWFKLLLTLGGSAVLIFILTLEPGQLFGEQEERSSEKDSSQAWHRRAMLEVQKFLEVKGWINSPPQYKLTDARPVQRVQRKLYRELLSLTQDEQAAIGLIKDSMRRHPRKPVNWCCEQVIKELRKPSPSRSSTSRMA